MGRKIRVLSAEQHRSFLRWFIAYLFVYLYWSPMILVHKGLREYVGCNLSALASIVTLIVSWKASVWMVLEAKRGINKFKHDGTRRMNGIMLFLISEFSIYHNLVIIFDDLKTYNSPKATTPAAVKPKIK